MMAKETIFEQIVSHGLLMLHKIPCSKPDKAIIQMINWIALQRK